VNGVEQVVPGTAWGSASQTAHTFMMFDTMVHSSATVRLKIAEMAMRTRAAFSNHSIARA
jgi:hypothetical protein